MSGAASQFAAISWRGAPLSLEYVWVGDADSKQPVVVFLHEGLGSVAVWKDFPEKFCSENGLRGLLFSRYGYGRSTPKPAGELWEPDFMRRQALEVLPALFAHLGIGKPWLFGHSDGGSISLLYAAHFSDQLSGIVVAAPHILVEEISVTSIQAAREEYVGGRLRERLARFHDDVDSAFWGWNDMWLNPSFRSWNIEEELAGITCPVLAIQGDKDEYGTLEQVYVLQRLVPKARVVVIPGCGHWPHRDQAAALTRVVANFILDKETDED